MTVPIPDDDEDPNINGQLYTDFEDEVSSNTATENASDTVIKVDSHKETNENSETITEEAWLKTFLVKIMVFYLNYIVYVLLSVKQFILKLCENAQLKKLFHRVKIKMKVSTEVLEKQFYRDKLDLHRFVKSFKQFPYHVYNTFPFLPSYNTYGLEIHNSMEFEGNRLASFANFPDIPGVYVTKLASAGFNYTGTGDEVICYNCGLQYKNWQKGDSPIEIHKRLSPSCVVVLPLNTESDTICHGTDITIQSACGVTNGIIRQESHNNGIESDSLEFNQQIGRHQQNTMIGLSACLKSTNDISNPVYHGVNQYSENVTLTDNLSTNDTHSLIRIPLSDGNPQSSSASCHLPGHIAKHERHEKLENGNLKYPKYSSWSMRFESYKSWPRHLKQTPEDMASAGFFFTGTEDHCRCFCCGGGLKNWEPNDSPWEEHARWYKDCAFVSESKGGKFVEDVHADKLTNPHAHQNDILLPDNIHGDRYLNNPVVRSVSELGYDHNIVKKAYEALTKSISEITSENLLEKIFELEEKSISNNLLPTEKEHPKPRQGLSEGRKENSKTEHEMSVRSLEEENQNLKDQQTCKICLDEPIGIVFLPCGHMASCINCAPALRKCPICRTFIKGTVKAKLS